MQFENSAGGVNYDEKHHSPDFCDLLLALGGIALLKGSEPRHSGVALDARTTTGDSMTKSEEGKPGVSAPRGVYADPAKSPEDFRTVAIWMGIIVALVFLSRSVERKKKEKEDLDNPLTSGPPEIEGGINIGAGDEYEEVVKRAAETAVWLFMIERYERPFSAEKFCIIGPIYRGSMFGHALVHYGDGSDLRKLFNGESGYRVQVRLEGEESVSTVYVAYACANGVLSDTRYTPEGDFQFVPSHEVRPTPPTPPVVEEPAPEPVPLPRFLVTRYGDVVVIEGADGTNRTVMVPGIRDIAIVPEAGVVIIGDGVTASIIAPDGHEIVLKEYEGFPEETAKEEQPGEDAAPEQELSGDILAGDSFSNR